MDDNAFPPIRKKRKKVDIEALSSPLKRIPGMNLASVRDLMDLGIGQVVELKGRSPEAIMEDVRKIREQTPPDRIQYYRLAVYFAETDDPDPQLLEPWKWV